MSGLAGRPGRPGWPSATLVILACVASEAARLRLGSVHKRNYSLNIHRPSLSLHVPDLRQQGRGVMND